MSPARTYSEIDRRSCPRPALSMAPGYDTPAGGQFFNAGGPVISPIRAAAELSGKGCSPSHVAAPALLKSRARQGIVLHTVLKPPSSFEFLDRPRDPFVLAAALHRQPRSALRTPQCRM